MGRSLVRKYSLRSDTPRSLTGGMDAGLLPGRAPEVLPCRAAPPCPDTYGLPRLSSHYARTGTPPGAQFRARPAGQSLPSSVLTGAAVHTLAGRLPVTLQMAAVNRLAEPTAPCDTGEDGLPRSEAIWLQLRPCRTWGL